MSGAEWTAANQAWLAAAVAHLRTLCEQADDAVVAGAQAAVESARAALPAPPALDTIGEAFGLSQFERSVLLLAASPELRADPAAPQPRPTFGLALGALPDPHWSALTPAAPLRHWKLIEIDGGPSLVGSTLRIDERILHALAGLHYLDERLAPLLAPLEPHGEPPPSHAAVAERVAALWRQPDAPGVVQLIGSDPGAARDIAASVCNRLHRACWTLRAADLPGSAFERDTLLRLWHREILLGGGVLALDLHEDTPALSAYAFLRGLRGRAFVLTRAPLRSIDSVRIDVRPAAVDEQSALWSEALGPSVRAADGEVAGVVQQFRLDVDAIRSAGTSARLAHIDGQATLWDAARAQARPHLDDLAQRIETVATWDDLVLPDGQREILRQIVASVSQRTTVFERWGFADLGQRGLGLTALFSGASGTGKTMAAEVIGGALRLDLYRIDLSQVVSKFIGETEKNLARVFDAAEQGGAVLLFDEADALFGRRSEVRDSHDRYANIEVSYLLQRMEAYRGLAILTTNMKSALDPSFLRRIRFVVQFPFPDATARAQIWRKVFPTPMPRESLDAEKLARLNVPGGNIRNIAMNAAFIAAAAHQPVRMEHLLQAARAEYAKLDKPLTGAEVAGWT